MQLTRLTVPGQVDLEYRFSASQNNGQITQLKDWVSGEEVSYAYDSLSRLSSAATTGPEWGQSYSYDGFGNRTLVTVTKGTAPGGNLTYDGMTNRITNPGFRYDANGNLTGMPGMAFSYDYDNRLAGYTYDPKNRRVWKGTQAYFYGVDGRKLGTYGVDLGSPSADTVSENLYFAGRLIKSNNQWVVTDRLGSVVKSGTETLRYFPWGEERSTTAQNRSKFGTYHRDSSGLDYALNRYYSSSHARFLTPDPYVSNNSLRNPQSWNRYPYVENDSVNFVDPAGLDRYAVEAFMGCVEAPWNAPWTWKCDPTRSANGGTPRGGGGRPIVEEPRGGSTAEPPRPKILGFDSAKDALQRPGCAKALGAPDAATARSRLENANVGFEDLGAFVVRDVGADYETVPGVSAPLADADPSTNAIRINSRLNWELPSQTPARIHGTQNLTLFDFQTALGGALGSPSLSADQFRTLVILHELGHLFNKPQEPGPASAYNRDIFKDCL